MQNIELFRQSQRSLFINDWFLRVKSKQSRALWQLFDDLLISKQFSMHVYDKNLSDLAAFFTKSFFTNNFGSVLYCLEHAGTFESYIILIKSALGEDSKIEFESTKKGSLTIKIKMPTELKKIGAFNAGKMKALEIADNALFCASHISSLLTISETEALIKLLTPIGISVNVDYIK